MLRLLLPGEGAALLCVKVKPCKNVFVKNGTWGVCINVQWRPPKLALVVLFPSSLSWCYPPPKWGAVMRISFMWISVQPSPTIMPIHHESGLVWEHDSLWGHLMCTSAHRSLFWMWCGWNRKHRSDWHGRMVASLRRHNTVFSKTWPLFSNTFMLSDVIWAE